jgi:anti-sigma B factor antagonist
VEDNGAVTVRLAGDYDVSTAATITDQVRRALAGGAREVVVDMADVVFMDSTALGALIEANHASHDAGAELRLVRVPANTHRLLTLTALDQVFRIEPA